MRQRDIQGGLAATVRHIKIDAGLQFLLQRGGVVFKNRGHNGGAFRTPGRTKPEREAKKQCHPKRHGFFLHENLHCHKRRHGTSMAQPAAVRILAAMTSPKSFKRHTALISLP